MIFMTNKLFRTRTTAITLELLASIDNNGVRDIGELCGW